MAALHSSGDTKSLYKVTRIAVGCSSSPRETVPPSPPPPSAGRTACAGELILPIGTFGSC
eukprot:11399689-Alexandrium_andersonii.AAC.1